MEKSESNTSITHIIALFCCEESMTDSLTRLTNCESYSQRPASHPELPCSEKGFGDGLGVRVVEELVGPFGDSGERTEIAVLGGDLSNVCRQWLAAKGRCFRHNGPAGLQDDGRD